MTPIYRHKTGAHQKVLLLGKRGRDIFSCFFI